MTNTIPTTFTDPINASILAVSEDRLQGFQRDPLGEISRQSGVEVSDVIERIRAMLRAGTIRRVRQTLLATNLAQGALVAWQVPQEKLDAAFDYMFQQRPVQRARGHPLDRCRHRRRQVPALDDAQGAAGLLDDRSTASSSPRQTGRSRSTGLCRRRSSSRSASATCAGAGLEPGSTRGGAGRRDGRDRNVTLSELEWRVLVALKREFAPDEIARGLWERARRRSGRARWRRSSQVAGGLQQRKHHRPLLHLPRARQTRGRRASASRASTPSSTGPCRRAARWTPAARSAATTS